MDAAKSKKKEKMRLSRLILILLVSVLVFTGATAFVYYNLHKPEIIKINMDLTAEDSNIIGINSDTDALHFGTVPRKGNSIKKIDIINNKNYPLFVNIIVEGNFRDWINISKNNFILEPKQSERIDFTAKIPEDAAYGTYNGTAYISLRRY
jgi:hypothetical protein